MSYPIIFEQTCTTEEELKVIQNRIWRLLNENVTFEVATHKPDSTEKQFFFCHEIFNQRLFKLLRSKRYFVTVRLLEKPLKITSLEW